jgi:hypothetical protein
VTLRRELDAKLKSRLGGLGYIKQLKLLNDTYGKKSPVGLHGVRCKIDARFDVSLCLSFCLRFDIVDDVMQLIEEETYKRRPELFRLDPKTEAYYAANRYHFECTYGDLAGLDKFAADKIEAESELEPLLDRTLQRIHDYGIPYFDKYGKLDEVVRVIEADSQEWKLLQITSSDFVLRAAATLFAVRGPDPMLEFVKRHRDDPNLIRFVGEQLDMLVDLSKVKRSKR